MPVMKMVKCFADHCVVSELSWLLKRNPFWEVTALLVALWRYQFWSHCLEAAVRCCCCEVTVLEVDVESILGGHCSLGCFVEVAVLEPLPRGCCCEVTVQ